MKLPIDLADVGRGQPGRRRAGQTGAGPADSVAAAWAEASQAEYSYQGGGTNPYPGSGRENLCGGGGTGKAILDITYTMENLWLCQNFRRLSRKTNLVAVLLFVIHDATADRNGFLLALLDGLCNPAR